MDIRRCASRRSGAEPVYVVTDVEPELSRDEGRVVLRALNNPSIRDPEGSQFDYEVFLSHSDIEQLRRFLASEVQHG